ncbi:MAG: hypothetical protein HY319_07305, partial [Armatimonadetes bacterium]|nr:hypothetical protein [Armatimonadota bacterium]
MPRTSLLALFSSQQNPIVLVRASLLAPGTELSLFESELSLPLTMDEGTLRFFDVPAGDYDLRVEGFDSDGVLVAGKTVRLSVFVGQITRLQVDLSSSPPPP